METSYAQRELTQGSRIKKSGQYYTHTHTQTHTHTHTTRPAQLMTHLIVTRNGDRSDSRASKASTQTYGKSQTPFPRIDPVHSDSQTGVMTLRIAPSASDIPPPSCPATLF